MSSLGEDAHFAHLKADTWENYLHALLQSNLQATQSILSYQAHPNVSGSYLRVAELELILIYFYRVLHKKK